MKSFYLYCIMLILFSGCISSPKEFDSLSKDFVPLSKQNSNSSHEYSLDSKIRICGDDIATKILLGTSIAVVNIETHEKRLSDYIINELVNVIVNKETLRVITRQKIDDLQEELNFNMSGFVSDDTVQSIGKMVGAETIVTGSITLVSDVYRLNIQILRTETGEILSAYGYDIGYDTRLRGLVDSTNANNTPIEIRGKEIINRNSHNFIQLREYARFLIGNEYYVCIGRCNLYTVWSNRDTGVIAYNEATGDTHITNVAVHVNPKTGEVLNIVTVNRIGREVPTTDELIGGFSIDEYFKTNTWIEAVRYIQENEI